MSNEVQNNTNGVKITPQITVGKTYFVRMLSITFDSADNPHENVNMSKSRFTQLNKIRKNI
jgi:hypothetical protein